MNSAKEKYKEALAKGMTTSEKVFSVMASIWSSNRHLCKQNYSAQSSLHSKNLTLCQNGLLHCCKFSVY